MVRQPVRRSVLDEEEDELPSHRGLGYLLLTGFGSVFALLIVFSSYFTVSQGYEGVVTRWGKAVYSVGPGLHFKVPFMDGVTYLEMRETTNSEVLTSATANGLPATIRYSQTWQIQEGMSLDFYKLYGTKERFESVILDRQVQDKAKFAISQFQAIELLQNRIKVSNMIEELMAEEMKRYPVRVISSQIEDVQFPDDYMDAIRAKEKAREDRDREQFVLEKQRLQAQQAVQTAEAEAQAKRLQAEAEAQAKLMVGEAEAKVIDQINKAIASNPSYVQYKMVERWSGTFPTTFMGAGGEGVNLLFNMPNHR